MREQRVRIVSEKVTGKNDLSQKKSNIFVLIFVVKSKNKPRPLVFSIVLTDADQFDNF